jgi:hypothetical protein
MGAEDWTCFAAELAHLISWAEIASQVPLTRHLYDAHDATADIAQVLGRALQ